MAWKSRELSHNWNLEANCHITEPGRNICVNSRIWGIFLYNLSQFRHRLSTSSEIVPVPQKFDYVCKLPRCKTAFLEQEMTAKIGLWYTSEPIAAIGACHLQNVIFILPHPQRSCLHHFFNSVLLNSENAELKLSFSSTCWGQTNQDMPRQQPEIQKY